MIVEKDQLKSIALELSEILEEDSWKYSGTHTELSERINAVVRSIASSNSILMQNNEIKEFVRLHQGTPDMGYTREAG